LLLTNSNQKTDFHRREWKDFDALDRKRRVDDVIVMVALRARILAGLNAVETASIGRVDPEQQWKNDFP